jgi:D-alanyl-D-alanine carboxypeptidase (penicillin-binding protein 5/6)
MVNKAKFLEQYAYAEGVKTGYTNQAGYCFAGSAYRDGRRLITVVLNSPQRVADTIALMEHGFNDWERMELPAGMAVGEAQVEDGVEAQTRRCAWRSRCAGSLPKAHKARYRWAVQATSLRAPVQAGDAAGWLVVYRDEKPILKAPVVAAEAVAQRRAFPVGLGWLALLGATMGILGWRRAKRRRPRAYRRAPLELGARTPKM